MSDAVYDTCSDRLDDVEAKCIVCGCTADAPCDGGCSWVPGLPFDICDRCVERMFRVTFSAAALRRHQTTPIPLGPIQELLLASAVGTNSVPDDGIFLSGHLHQHCRDELQTALDELAEAMRERAQADLATLRAAFEGSPDE